MSSLPSSSRAATDVLVIGGGPAGSTIATLLRRKGLSVRLVEKDRHPRFHIGESLLPMNMPILDQLGVTEQVAAIGVRKLGADFPTRNERGYNTFEFRRTLNPTPGFAYQVKREEFDELLFRHAAREGVDTLEDCQVASVAFDADGATATVRQGQSANETLRARYVVDATGRDTLLGRQFDLKRKSRAHQSAALFAHFRGVTRRPGEDAGNISVYRFAHGWVWVIPLRDDITSVGAVCSPEYLKHKRGRGAEFLIETLGGIDNLSERLAGAELVGHLHATGNYSYACSRMAGPRWLMVGDAYAFVDPIFSSGVFLAMNSAVLAADVVEAALREPAREPALQSAYARTIREGVDAFSWFIHRFTSPAMRYLFANPRNNWRLEEALISMLAGDVFRDGGVRKRLRLFKAIYFVTALGMWREQWRHYRARGAGIEARFEGGTTGQDHA